MTLGRRLHVNQPAQGTKGLLHHLLPKRPLAGQQQGLHQPAVGIGDDLLDPGPIVAGRLLPTVEQARSQFVADPLGAAVTRKAAQMFVDTEQAVGPRPRAGELQHGGERPLKHLGGQAGVPQHLASTFSGPQSPKGPAVRILGAHFFQPATIEAQKIAKAPRLFVQSVLQKTEVPSGQQAHRQTRRVDHVVRRPHRHNQGPGVVVGTVAVIPAGHVEPGVLIDPRIVGEHLQVIELDFRQVQRPLAELLSPVDGAGIAAPLLLHPGEEVQISGGHLGPAHLPGVEVGPLADGVPLDLVVQQLDHRRGQRFLIVEGHQNTTVFGEHLHGVPVGSRDGRFPRSHRVGQGPGDDLGFVRIGSNVDVRGTEKLLQFLQLDEFVMEDHVIRHASLGGTTLERVAIVFTLPQFFRRVGGAQYDIHGVRMLGDDLRQCVDHPFDSLAGGE